MRPAKTYFEQIPVEMVQKIATEFSQGEPMEKDSPGAQTRNQATTSGDDWRELAQKVQEEPDNTKMLGMVEELIAKLDEADRRKRQRLTRDNQNKSGPTET
jgi:hypothetical protein